MLYLHTKTYHYCNATEVSWFFNLQDSWQDDILEGKQGSLSFREWFPNLSKVNEMISPSLAG